ncbi:MAG: hypothetical protein ACXWCM_17540 [Acidimicrobiales bacterium]
MADQRSSIDLTTLAEVQRLLASTDFASVDDLARRSGVIDRDEAVRLVRASAAQAPSVALVDSADATPLPRRR